MPFLTTLHRGTGRNSYFVGTHQGNYGYVPDICGVVVANLNPSRLVLAQTPKCYDVNFGILVFHVPLPTELAALQLISACGGIRFLFLHKVVLGFCILRCRT